MICDNLDSVTNPGEVFYWDIVSVATIQKEGHIKAHKGRSPMKRVNDQVSRNNATTLTPVNKTAV
jgi:hypothetical protein